MKPKENRVHKVYPHTRSTIKYLMSLVPPCQILDVGSRDGYAMGLLKKAGFSVAGIEINKEWANNTGSINADFLAHPFADKFDAIYGRHVFEHCADSLGFLNKCHDLLVDNGILLLTFPLERRIHKEHLVAYDSMEAVGLITRQSKFVDYTIDMSKDLGIKPMKNEVCLVGRK